jgi:hypothetical protein
MYSIPIHVLQCRLLSFDKESMESRELILYDLNCVRGIKDWWFPSTADQNFHYNFNRGVGDRDTCNLAEFDAICSPFLSYR